MRSWSLSLEEQFYLLWPLLLFVNLKFAKRAAIAIIIAVTLWRTWLTFHIAPGIMAMRRIFYAPDTRMDVILYGCLLAFILADREKCDHIRRIMARRWVPFLLLTAFLFAVHINNRWGGHLGNSIGYSISAIVMALIIAYIHTAQPKFLLAMLEWRPVVWCGRISYGMYLFHSLVIVGVIKMFGAPNTGTQKVIFSLSVYGGTIAVSSLSYIFFESRFLRMKNRFSSSSIQQNVALENAPA